MRSSCRDVAGRTSPEPCDSRHREVTNSDPAAPEAKPAEGASRARTTASALCRGRGPLGPVPWSIFGLYVVTEAAVLWAVFELTGSALAQGATLLVVSFPYRLLLRRAGARRPFPPPPAVVSRRSLPAEVALFVAACGVGLGLIVGLAYAAEAVLRFTTGFWFWFYLGFGVPLMALGNRYGTQPEGADLPAVRRT